MIHSANLTSSGQRKSQLMNILSRHSWVNWPVGVNSGGRGGRGGIPASESGCSQQTMRKFSGKVIATGRVLFVTFLYSRLGSGDRILITRLLRVIDLDIEEYVEADKFLRV